MRKIDVVQNNPSSRAVLERKNVYFELIENISVFKSFLFFLLVVVFHQHLLSSRIPFNSNNSKD
jgi:hypothetical protein